MMPVRTYTHLDLNRAIRVANNIKGGRYIWGGCSAAGSDCSGCQSILLNAINGEANVFVRRFGTGNFKDRAAALGFVPGLGDDSDFSVGLIYPWESRSGIGHIAGTLGTLPVESRGGKGVLVGGIARSATSSLFRHHYHLPIRGVAPTVPAVPRLARVLQVGMRGEDVKVYQRQMVKRGWRLAADGIFGARTREVTLAFQREKRLTVDGIVGPQTWRAVFTLPT